MECKSFRDSDILYCHLRINRYIMECKSFRDSDILYCHLELIDTLWNVNQLYDCRLQDTKLRINRYIMECKYECGIFKFRTFVGINRYIMECK